MLDRHWYHRLLNLEVAPLGPLVGGLDDHWGRVTLPCVLDQYLGTWGRLVGLDRYKGGPGPGRWCLGLGLR